MADETLEKDTPPDFKALFDEMLDRKEFGTRGEVWFFSQVILQLAQNLYVYVYVHTRIMIEV